MNLKHKLMILLIISITITGCIDPVGAKEKIYVPLPGILIEHDDLRNSTCFTYDRMDWFCYNNSQLINKEP